MTTATLCRYAALAIALAALCPAAETDHLANVPMAFSAPTTPGAPARFAARGRNHLIELTAQGADLVFEKGTLSLRVRGANPNATPSPERRLPGTANYFTTQDKSKWQHNLPTYAAIRYPNVLPGIDLVYYGQGKQLEYDFVLAPGANPNQIEMQVSKGWKRRLTADGTLEITADGGSVRFAKPVSYQLDAQGHRQPIESAYQPRPNNSFGFRVGPYDRTRPLIIDPVFIFGTYLGGNVSDIARAVAVDSARNVWVAGRTLSVNFPVTNGTNCQGGPLGQPCGFGSTTPSIAPWGFVTKFDPTGTRVLFSTYLGGINVTSEGGDGSDFGGTTINALTLDQTGNVYLAGRTASPAFPTTADALQPLRARRRQSTWPGPCAAPSLVDSGGKDAFVTKLSPAGNILYSTFLGGTGYEEANGIAVNSVGEIFVVGQTTSAVSYSLNFTACSFDQGLFANFGFPVTATAYAGAVNEELGVNKGFLTKIATNGSLAYSTYLGVLRTDSSGPGRFNPFVVATGVAVDAGTAYISGFTRDAEWGGGCRNCNTTTNANAYDAFAMKLTPLVSGQAGLGYLRVFGGTAQDIGSGIAIDAGGSAYIGGTTSVNGNVSTADPGFPTTPGAFQIARAFSSPGVVETDDCGFVTKLGPTGSTTYSSLLCAGPRNQATINAIAVHQASGTAIVTGSAHATLPLVSPVATNVPTGVGAFVTRFNAAGSALLFSSFLAPAVANDNQAVGNAIAVDPDLNAYIAGSSPDQLTMSTPNAFSAGGNGGVDAFLVKVNVSQPPPTSMTIVTGSPQAATVGTNFTTPFQVLLRDASAQPTPGINVTFSGLGQTLTVSTDAQGLATAPQFAANAVPGPYTLSAAALNLTTVNFNVYSLPTGATISTSAGAGQSIPAGLAFGTALQALVRNAASVPLAGVPVTFTAPASGAGATFAGTTTVLTNASGLATAPALTSNTTQGSYNATATVTSLPAVTTNFNLTNLPPNLTPTVGAVSPAFADTVQQTMVFTFTDANGFADLNVLNVLVNTALDARNGCYIAYVRAANILYLVANNGVDLLGPITLGATGTVSNSQCTIAAAGSSAVGNGNGLTMTLNTTFLSAFGGRKIIYAAARDANLANSGWRVVGINSVPPLPAASPAVGPSSLGQFTSQTQTGTFTFTSNAGVADLGVLNVLINTALDGRNACYFAYVRAANVFYLVDDIGTGLSAALTPGTAQTITNSQCTLNGTGTSAVLAGNTVTLTVNYSMKTPAFSGPKVVWGASRTNGDAANSGWQAIASWLIP